MFRNIEDFHDILIDLDEKVNNLKMVIGISVSSEDDSKFFSGQNIFVGISDYYKENKVNSTDWKQLILDFNSKFISYNYVFNLFSISNLLKKFSKIIFDWSVFKFLENPYFIFYLYYILLQEGGELYIEITEASHVGVLIKEKNIIENYDENTFIKSYGTKYIHKNNHNSRPNRISHIHKFFEKFLINSKVELLDNELIKYPINKNIKNYLKITKMFDCIFDEEFSICKNIRVREYEILSKL